MQHEVALPGMYSKVRMDRVLVETTTEHRIIHSSKTKDSTQFREQIKMDQRVFQNYLSKK